MIDFDFLLLKVGGIGKYQLLVFAMVAYFGIPSGLNALAAVFISYSPTYRCAMYPFDNKTAFPNISESEIMNLTTPLDNKGAPLDPCVRYSYDTSSCSEHLDFSCVNRSAQTIECSEFHFDKSLFTETTVSQFQLVCQRRVLNTVGSSMYMAGFFIGALLFGNFSDILGRKAAGIIGSYGTLISMLGVAYCNSVESFIIARCAVAIFAMGANIALFTHIMEIVDSKWRTRFGLAYQATFAFGYMWWSAIAYLYRDWRQMQLGALVLSAPLALVILFVPESPRWLFTRGKERQGKKDEPQQNHSTLELFRHRGTTILTAKLAFNWAVNSMVYYGISLNAGSLAGGILEIASYMTTLLIMDRVGRRLLLTITLTSAGVALLASTVVNEFADDNQSLITTGVIFAFIGKACVSSSFAVVYNFTGELYPTVIRSNGIGFGAMTARIGGILAPYVISLQDYVSWLPGSIFGAIAVAGGLLSLTLRDTTGLRMMETIEEAEIFYAGGDIGEKNDLSTSRGYANKAAMFDDEDNTKL